jgi:hypothetical protein
MEMSSKLQLYKQAIFVACKNKFYSFSAVLGWSFSNFEKYIGARTIGIKSWDSELLGNNMDR